VAFCQEFAPNLKIVINGPVKYDRVPTALTTHWLFATLGVYDRQPLMAQSDPLVDVFAGVIGASMGQERHHAGELLFAIR
jgi:hypothetical protein